MWASCVRIIATALIFIFHFQSLYDRPSYSLALYGITAFLFLSGYFSYQPSTFPLSWLLRRFKKIMISYWLVIIPILIINEVIHYKQTTLTQNIIIVMGGSMLLKDPVYIISWFITLILLLYVVVYITHLLRFSFQVLFCLGCVIFFYKYLSVRFIYLVGFLVGYLWRYFLGLKRQSTPKKESFLNNICRRSFLDKINMLLFNIQNYCYSFFLIHGGILLLGVKILKLKPTACFVFSMIISSILTFFHRKVSLSIEKLLVLL